MKFDYVDIPAELVDDAQSWREQMVEKRLPRLLKS
jgi:hypothetical protein